MTASAAARRVKFRSFRKTSTLPLSKPIYRHQTFTKTESVMFSYWISAVIWITWLPTTDSEYAECAMWHVGWTCIALWYPAVLCHCVSSPSLILIDEIDSIGLFTARLKPLQAYNMSPWYQMSIAWTSAVNDTFSHYAQYSMLIFTHLMNWT